MKKIIILSLACAALFTACKSEKTPVDAANEALSDAQAQVGEIMERRAEQYMEGVEAGVDLSDMNNGELPQVNDLVN